MHQISWAQKMRLLDSGKSHGKRNLSHQYQHKIYVCLYTVILQYFADFAETCLHDKREATEKQNRNDARPDTKLPQYFEQNIFA